MDFSASGMAGNRSLLKTFRDGLYTQLSNPKTALVFASIFTALLPAQIPTAFYYIVPLMSFLIDVSWYSLVALVLSADRPRRVYLRLKRRIDIATATVLGALGLRLSPPPSPASGLQYRCEYRAAERQRDIRDYSTTSTSISLLAATKTLRPNFIRSQTNNNFAALFNDRFLELAVGIVKAGQARLWRHRAAADKPGRITCPAPEPPPRRRRNRRSRAAPAAKHHHVIQRFSPVPRRSPGVRYHRQRQLGGQRLGHRQIGGPGINENSAAGLHQPGTLLRDPELYRAVFIFR